MRSKGGMAMKKYQSLKMAVLKINVDIITTSGNIQNEFESNNGYDDVIGDFAP